MIKQKSITKYKFIALLILFPMVIMVFKIGLDASWESYIEQSQTDPEKTATAFAKSLSSNQLNYAEMLVTNELKHNLNIKHYDHLYCQLPTGFTRNKFHGINDFSGFKNGVRLDEKFNNGQTIRYDLAYLCGPTFARYGIIIFGVEVEMQEGKWFIKKLGLVCNYRRANGCGG